MMPLYIRQVCSCIQSWDHNCQGIDTNQEWLLASRQRSVFHSIATVTTWQHKPQVQSDLWSKVECRNFCSSSITSSSVQTAHIKKQIALRILVLHPFGPGRLCRSSKSWHLPESSHVPIKEDGVKKSKGRKNRKTKWNGLEKEKTPPYNHFRQMFVEDLKLKLFLSWNV